MIVVPLSLTMLQHQLWFHEFRFYVILGFVLEKPTARQDSWLNSCHFAGAEGSNRLTDICFASLPTTITQIQLPNLRHKLLGCVNQVAANPPMGSFAPVARPPSFAVVPCELLRQDQLFAPAGLDPFLRESGPIQASARDRGTGRRCSDRSHDTVLSEVRRGRVGVMERGDVVIQMRKHQHAPSPSKLGDLQQHSCGTCVFGGHVCRWICPRPSMYGQI